MRLGAICDVLGAEETGCDMSVAGFDLISEPIDALKAPSDSLDMLDATLKRYRGRQQL